MWFHSPVRKQPTFIFIPELILLFWVISSSIVRLVPFSESYGISGNRQHVVAAGPSIEPWQDAFASWALRRGCWPSERSVFLSHTLAHSPTHTLGERMAARLLLLLLCVCSVLSWVGAEDAYARLSESYRNGVDLALEQLNSHAGVHHHFRFLRSLEKTEIEVRPRFIQKIMLFSVSSFFYYYFVSKGVGKVQIGAVVFNLEEFSKFMLPSGKIASYSTCFHFCFRPDGIFKLLHVHSRMSLPFLFLSKRLMKSSFAGFCRCGTQNSHALIVLQRNAKVLLSLSPAATINFKPKNMKKMTIKLPLPTFKKLAIGWSVLNSEGCLLQVATRGQQSCRLTFNFY